MAKMNKATKIALVTGEIKDCMSAARTRAVQESRTHARLRHRRRAARSQSAASAWARAKTRCDVLVLQRNRQRARQGDNKIYIYICPRSCASGAHRVVRGRGDLLANEAQSGQQNQNEARAFLLLRK